MKFNWSRCLEAMCKYFQYLQTWLIPSCKYVVKIFWNSIFFLWGLNSVYDLKQILMRRVCQSNTYKNLRYENRLHSKFMKEYTIIFTTLPMKREIGFLKFSRYLSACSDILFEFGFRNSNISKGYSSYFRISISY